MENCVKIAMDANRRTVREGMNRRKLDKQMEAFEREMIECVNRNAEAAEWERQDRRERDLCMARIAKRAEMREKARKERKDIALACLIFFASSAMLLQLTKWTDLNVWGACLYILLFAMLLFAFIAEKCSSSSKKGGKTHG